LSLIMLDLTEAKHAALAERPRAKARNFFKGANDSRLTGDWVTSILSADQELWSDLRKLRMRSRELAKNTWIGEKFLSMVANNVIGDKGIALQVKVRKQRGKGWNEALGDDIEDSWERFYWVADAAKSMTLRDIERLAVRTMVQDGEAILRKVRSPRNVFNYSLQFVDADQLDHTFFVERLPSGNEIRMGVEVDPMGAPVAYYIWNHHPSEWTSVPKERIRVPASDIIHMFIKNRVGQTRGYPWMAPVLYDTNMLRGYLEAELVASRTGAAAMAFFTSKTGDEYVGEGINADDGSVQMDADPGTFKALPPGVDVKEWNPQHPSVAFPAFVKTCLRGVAAGLGVSYHAMANDLEGVNYSSGRLGELADRDGWRSIQRYVIDHLMQPIYTDFIAMGFLSGEVKLGKYDIDTVAASAVWRPRGWAWIDPLKDSQATVLEIQNALTTVTDTLAEQGIDVNDLAETRKDELDLFDSLNLQFGTDTKGKADTVPDPNDPGAESPATGSSGDGGN
jgi:lambda family phage portal protein